MRVPLLLCLLTFSGSMIDLSQVSEDCVDGICRYSEVSYLLITNLNILIFCDLAFVNVWNLAEERTGIHSVITFI